jgi:O-antigen/teichoic acid export membrane protein
LIKSLFQYAPVQIFSALSVFILIAVQTRFLQASEYGYLAIFLVISEVLRAVSAQWLNTSLIRFYPSAELADRNKFVNIILQTMFAIFIPAIFVLIICVFFVVESFDIVLTVSLISLLITKSIFTLYQELARLNENVKKYRLSTIVNSGLSIIFSIIFLSYKSSVISAILAISLSYLFSLFFIIFKTNIKFISWSDPLLVKIARYGLPLMLSGLISALSSRIDRFFIASEMGMTETGVYSVLSNTFMGLIALIFMAVALPLYPNLARNVTDKKKLYQSHSDYLNILFTISLPALIGLCFISEQLIRLFLSTEYLEYGVELSWILACSFFILNFKMHYVDHGLQFTSNTKYYPIISVLSIVINVVILIMMLPHFGLYAAALSSLITNVIALAVSFFISIKLGYKFKFDKDLIYILTSAILMMISLITLNLFLTSSASDFYYILISIIFGVAVYLLSIFLFNVLKIRSKVMEKINA